MAITIIKLPSSGSPPEHMILQPSLSQSAIHFSTVLSDNKEGGTYNLV